MEEGHDSVDGIQLAVVSLEDAIRDSSHVWNLNLSDPGSLPYLRERT